MLRNVIAPPLPSVAALGSATPQEARTSAALKASLASCSRVHISHRMCWTENCSRCWTENCGGGVSLKPAIAESSSVFSLPFTIALPPPADAVRDPAREVGNRVSSKSGITTNTSTCLRRTSSAEAARKDADVLGADEDLATARVPCTLLLRARRAPWRVSPFPAGSALVSCPSPSRSRTSAALPLSTLARGTLPTNCVACIAAHAESHSLASERVRATRRRLHSMPARETAPGSALLQTRRVSTRAVGPSGESSESATRKWRVTPSRAV
mmetsp:Transcript_10255/g.33852  ORF Transcript_10255/g.33852 Transcript_10255/m.33852 type:complete len:270 (+) Transcript_10255:11858-12667(+)